MKFNSPRVYAGVVGLILFIIGIWGFAFRSNPGLSDGYLILFLILGFWGILVSFSSKS